MPSNVMMGAFERAGPFLRPGLSPRRQMGLRPGVVQSQSAQAETRGLDSVPCFVQPVYRDQAFVGDPSDRPSTRVHPLEHEELIEQDLQLALLPRIDVLGWDQGGQSFRIALCWEHDAVKIEYLFFKSLIEGVFQEDAILRMNAP
jgi:hypothetical protein